MAKKMQMSMKEDCSSCGSSPCGCYGACWSRWCKAFCGLLVLVLGLLMLWPRGWFTFEHSVGLLVVLFGLWKFFHCCFKCR